MEIPPSLLRDDQGTLLLITLFNPAVQAALIEFIADALQGGQGRLLQKAYCLAGTGMAHQPIQAQAPVLAVPEVRGRAEAPGRMGLVRLQAA